MSLDLSKVKTVRMAIFQPRLQTEPECPEWSCDIATLEKFAEKCRKAVLKSEEALKHSDKDLYLYADGISWEKDYLKTSEKGCQWCKAKSTCPALAKDCLQYVAAPATLDGLEDLDAHYDAQGIDLGDEVAYAISNLPKMKFNDLARIYEARDQFKNWLAAVEDQMLTEMLAGEKHKNWKLVKGRGGNRAWTDPDEVEETMKAMRLKVDEMYDKQLISPTAAEKLLKKRPKLWSKLEKSIGRSDGKPTIAPMSSKQESIDPYADALATLPDFTLEDLLGLPQLPEEPKKPATKKKKAAEALELDINDLI